jgi:hypothetical protein
MPSLGPRAIAVGLHRQQDALRAAAADRAADGFIGRGLSAAQHVGGHGDDLGLVLGRAGPDVGVQRVALRIQGVDAVQEVDVFGVAVVDRAGDEAVAPARIFLLLECFDLVQDGRPVAPLFRQAAIGRVVAAIGLERRLQRAEHLVIAPLQAAVDRRHGAQPALQRRGRGGEKAVEQFARSDHVSSRLSRA